MRLPRVDLTIDMSNEEDDPGEDRSDEEFDSFDFDEEGMSGGEGDFDSDEEEDENTEEGPEWHSRIHLCLLEDDKWTCCAHCEKLLPHEEFPTGELSLTSSRRRCAKHARLYDICLCIPLTPPDRARIVRYL